MAMLNAQTPDESTVGVVDLHSVRYPYKAPYHPHEFYPEYPFGDYISKEKNFVYDGVRNLLKLLELDKKRFGKPDWNPLGEIIKPGMVVVLKPNFILSFHAQKKDIYSTITHPAMIRAIADYCLIALRGEGIITIADAPQYNCNWNQLMGITQLPMVVGFLKLQTTTEIQLLDLRDYWAPGRHFPSNTKKLTGDPMGSVLVNLGQNSAMVNHPNPQRFYGAVYDRKETIKHHIGRHQEYKISRTILKADVLINIPKMKVHKKVGVTLNQKNLVGTCTNKNFLVHYTLGLPSEGGDQFPGDALNKTQQKVIKFERWMYDHFLSSRTLLGEYIHRLVYGLLYLKIFSHIGLEIPDKVRILDAGNWHGNDSAWRMVVDLAKIIRFSDKNGQIHRTPQRQVLSIVDGVIGGDKLGPLEPDPHPAGIIIGGKNFLAVDLVTTRLMGYNPEKLKQFTKLDARYNFGPRKIQEIKVISNNKRLLKVSTNNKDRYFNFLPHPGWRGHIEI